MARKLIALFVFVIVIVFSISASSVHGRRLMMKEQNHNSNNNAQSTTTFDRLYLVALPKRPVPASAPSKKGHSFAVDEKLVARHLGAVDRILNSHPAPGTGN